MYDHQVERIKQWLNTAVDLGCKDAMDGIRQEQNVLKNRLPKDICSCMDMDLDFWSDTLYEVYNKSYQARDCLIDIAYR